MQFVPLKPLMSCPTLPLAEFTCSAQYGAKELWWGGVMGSTRAISTPWSIEGAVITEKQSGQPCATAE